MSGDLEPGQLVFSSAGRDKDRPFLALEIHKVDKGTYVYLVDGDQRKIHRPKRKNIRHLKVTKVIALEIAEKLKLGQAVSNVEIRKAITGLMESNELNSFS